MPLRALLLGLIACRAWAAPEAAIGYAQATGTLKAEARPTLFQPLNLLDGRDQTAWCSPTADPLNELLTFGFDRSVRLDELRVTTGNNFSPATFAAFSRARRLLLKSGRQTRVIELADVRGPQVITLATPLTGTRFSVEIVDQHPADEPEQPVCLTDVVFVAQGRPLNGPWLTTRLKFDRARASLLGTWYTGFEGTPDRFLAFTFAGTFRYSFEPFDEVGGPPVVLEGSYELKGNRLELVINRRRHVLTVRRSPEGRSLPATLVFEGALPDELKGRWRSSP